jgi:hypothetical protein
MSSRPARFRRPRPGSRHAAGIQDLVGFVILIGVAITLPAIIGYTIFMYRVFGGRAQALSYGAAPPAEAAVRSP